MNPSEMRMLWMSQYNPERITLEDAATFFGHSSVGLSVMDDLAQQQSMDINPMLSIVGGEFSGQAAAAVAIGAQQTQMIAANPNSAIYGLAQVGELHQQLLQHTAAAALQNYTEIIDDDDGGNGVGTESHSTGVDGMSLDDTKALPTQLIHTGLTEQQQQLYGQMVDGTYDEGISELTPKQEYINIDDFAMMTDSSSYDGPEFLPTLSKARNQPILVQGLEESEELLVQPAGQRLQNDDDSASVGTVGTLSGAGASGSGGQRSQRKTRKIEPVSRPGLVLKTPIAYKGNIDPSVIPIQKDGMAVCERCGAIGVKHTFYTKSRRFCSMSCARGELYSLMVNNKMIDSGVTQQEQQPLADGLLEGSDEQQQGQQQSDIELALRVEHIKSSNYRFRITDQSKITQINGFGEPIMSNASDLSSAEELALVQNTASLNEVDERGAATESTGPKALRLYHDVLPQDELPQIPKIERLPTPCPQMEKIMSIRRRLYDPSHSYDWTARLSQLHFYAAPVTCFPHAPGYEVWDNIRVSMKVEVENTDCDNLEVIQPGQTPHSFWVATILNISGYKALMRYEGFDDSTHDFWVNLCNAEVHSVGWCATRGKPLIPPRTIENKYKDWKDFLVERLSGAITLPSSFYNKINDSMQSRFRLGLSLECVDKDRISQVRLATVTKIVGKRLFLRYFDSDDGFWCHEDSPIIHPVGWATTVDHYLAAPQDYLDRMMAGREAMIEVHEDDATIELFKMNFTFEEYYLDGKTNGFIGGMKLEAVDPLNLSSICAATVMRVLKFGYMMIRIDSYQPDATGSDWFCYHERSPSIFPVGFCASNNISLTPPNGYDINTFNWESYLQDSGSVAASQQLFHRVVPNHGFEVGMSLECADLMDPRLVCVATVARVVGRLLKIHFDGWTDEYDQWLDCESPDVYPVGWCTLVNHKLEGPPPAVQTAVKPAAKPKLQKKRKKKPTTVATARISNECTVKPRTIALKTNPHLPKLSIKLELKPEHHNAAFYEDNDAGAIAGLTTPGGLCVGEEDDNDDDYEEDSNSLRSNRSTPMSATDMANSLAAATQPATPQPTKSALGAVATTTATAVGGGNSTSLVQSRTNNVTVKKPISPAPPSVGRKATSYIGNSSVSNSKFIPRLTDTHDSGNCSELDLMPETWHVYDVSQFLRVNDCTAHCDTFSRNKIDGKRLMQLSKDEIITLLGMKVGPALKIFDLIQQLRCKANPGKARMHQKANKAFL